MNLDAIIAKRATEFSKLSPDCRRILGDLSRLPEEELSAFWKLLAITILDMGKEAILHDD